MDASGGSWWQLQCCSDNQLQSIFVICGYTVLIFKLWRFPLLHPFKILTVFLHELGHALAVWMTCGKVTSMEVHPNEGGVTSYAGGVALIIVPAGYLGSAVWGMALVIASPERLASEIAAGVLIFFLVLFIYYAKNAYMRWLNAGFIVILGGLIALDRLVDGGVHALRFVILFMGVMSCLFSIYDIWDDLIARRINDSDASVFAKMTHTSSRCWGVIWGLFALGTMGGAVYLNLLVIQHVFPGPSITAIRHLSGATTAALAVSATVLGLGVLHTIFTRRCMVRTGSNQFGYVEAA
ncbi:hypothetical protein, variant [Aphanomyces invadans]|uniref:Uncharacterized protein n=1 Tax=Aphanomyces invadans TaxID=157072 RepID=A0A024UM45_9STRA|nr:hypothetical protein, variant [Aphanomyces invadans]ETW06703.1 hypothetical protein, variant [Aphanomyces invadans]|eukprot:XP_008864778.1 hypothetical protein, variant [Aphanomyces invadans]